MLPVMAAAGGSGRSTVAFLLAQELAAGMATVVFDTAPRLSSPWPSCTRGQNAEGLAALPADQPLTRSRVRHAAAVSSAPGGATWQMLTDGRDWHTAPLPLPTDPAAWYQLAAIGGWQAVLGDTVHPVTHDLLAARWSGQMGQTRGWSELPYTIPVLCATATADGTQALQQAAMALQAEGLPLKRSVVVLVATGEGRPPAVARAAATMLGAQTSAVVHLPYDPSIRAHGLRGATRARPRTRQAAAQIARAVLAAAYTAWGSPLPAAAQPAPLPAPSAY